MKKGQKKEKVLIIENLQEFFQLSRQIIYLQLKQETKLSNLHIKKAFWEMQNGLPYYDMNKILREVSIELADNDLICRFTLCYSISDGATTQNLECICNGKHYLTMMQGIEGINSILNQIGFEKRLEEPRNIYNLVVWK
jgi:hypothetical protein